jgi:WD40 repeat protein
LGAAWHERLHEAYDPLVDSTAAPADYGRPVFEEKEVLTIAPAVSADGRQLAFISSRDLFSVDAFIGDLETGQVVRKLTRTAVDPHFESLQSINSAGAWSPDGSTFAIAGISAGRPVLSLIDVASGDRKRTIELPQLGEIFTPAWSPDGRSMVFSALQGGLSDLFVYDLERDDLRRLTNDPYGDLHPSWSPDGRRIVFASDRLTTNLEQLEYGAYQLVLMDPTTRAVTPVPGFETGKHINPQWAPDGESIYFLSDRNGVTNLYRVYLGDGRLAQITNLYTGISGITPGSPALSVAQQTGRVVISIYTGGLYRMHVIDDPAVLAGEPVHPLFAGLEPARLPPADPITSQVSEMLADTRTGLPDTAEFLSKNYSAGLGLDYVGRPSLVFASDRYGTYFGAGAELYWSDMLGNRNLVTQLQVNGGLKDIAAVAGYTNRSRRLNWGVFAQQIPYINRFYNAGFVANPADSSIAFAEQIVTFRQTNRDLSGLVAYPLNRAQRLEFTLGFRDVRFDQELKTILSDPNSGQKIDEFEESQASFDPVTMGLGSAALVYDQSLFGATSPILGQRYRVELSPSLGSLNLINVLADYRRYIVPVRPFTIAARVVHYGRYLGDAQDQRLQPLFRLRRQRRRVLPTFQSPDRKPDPHGQPGAAVPVARPPGVRQRLLRPAPHRSGAVRRRRPRLVVRPARDPRHGRAPLVRGRRPASGHQRGHQPPDERLRVRYHRGEREPTVPARSVDLAVRVRSRVLTRESARRQRGQVGARRRPSPAPSVYGRPEVRRTRPHRAQSRGCPVRGLIGSTTRSRGTRSGSSDAA